MPTITLKCTILFVFAVVYLTEISGSQTTRGCSKGKRKYGCQIENNQCMCGFGCDVSFPFRFRSKCEEHLARLQAANSVDEESSDPCQPNPCNNQGVCMQHHNGQFNCQCAGTGHYGKHCHKACPTSLEQDVYTQDMASCIEI